MTVEVRRWWIDQMKREAEKKAEEFEALSGRKTVDVK